MKYAGNISILDDEGNTVFERELTDDEIVEAILASVPDGTEAEPDEDEPLPAPKKKAEKAKGKSWVEKSCCGSKGARHMKTCIGGTEPVLGIGARAKADQAAWDSYEAPIQQDQFDDIKSLQLDGMSTANIAAETELDVIEVELAMKARTLEDYCLASRKEHFKG